MKRILAAAVATAALLVATPAMAQDRSFYGRLDVGAGVAGDVEFAGDVTQSGQTLPYSDNSDLDLGWQVGGALGVENFPLPNWRLEGEALYLNNETDDDEDNFDDVFDTGDDGNDDDGTSADIDIYGGFANLVYDFPGFQGPFGGENTWRPFLGAGVGYGKVKVEYAEAEADDEVFMWQAKAGLNYDISDNTTLELGYRYLNAESADVTDDDIGLDVTGTVDTEIHSVVAGLRWRFGGGYY